MGLLTREMILAVDDLPHEDVDVPEWGGTVRVQALNAQAGQRFAGLMAQASDDDQVRVRLLSVSLVDDAGGLLFGLADVEALARKNFGVVRKLSDIAFRLNGYGQRLNDAVENLT